MPYWKKNSKIYNLVAESARITMKSSCCRILFVASFYKPEADSVSYKMRNLKNPHLTPDLVDGEDLECAEIATLRKAMNSGY